MTKIIAPEWIAFEPARWMAGTAEMDALTEFVFFRLCLIAYESGSPEILGSNRRNAMRCKVELATYEGAIDLLIELEKLEVIEGGYFVKSAARRLVDSQTRISARQRGAAISRRKRELKFEGKKEAEIDLIISKEFSDNQSDDQNDNNNTDKTKQTDKTKHTEGECEGKQLALSVNGENVTDCRKAFDLWNDFAGKHDLSRAIDLSAAREKSLKARLTECGGVEGWKIALAIMEKSPYLLGKKPGSDWRASFDFMLQKSSFLKIMEGQYTPAEAKKQQSSLMASLQKLQGK